MINARIVGGQTPAYQVGGNLGRPEFGNDLDSELMRYCQEHKLPERQVIEKALSQYLTIKDEESAFRRQYPGQLVHTQIIVEAAPPAYQKQAKASVLIY